MIPSLGPSVRRGGTIKVMQTYLPLNDGYRMPALGFGLYKVPADQTEQVVLEGVAAGYLMVDGAEFYANEAEVGKALRSIEVDRSLLTVTSKFWGEDSQDRDAVLASFEATEKALGTVVDVYMIHWPRPQRNQYVDVWRTLIELRDEGRIRSVGVSNFTEAHLQRLIDETGVVPVVNQVELHPYLQQEPLRAFHREHGIVTQAWSPLGRGNVLEDPVIREIAAAHGVTSAQVIIRWHLQLGNSVIPKSAHPGRLASNLDVFGFELSDDDMAAVGALERGQRYGTSPDERQ
ncbi:MAG: aldo/keto reductase [Propionibacteriaceae bacterium]|nr:aldo/keto reductase [Propionibacteriaceae bacterium]